MLMFQKQVFFRHRFLQRGLSGIIHVVFRPIGADWAIADNSTPTEFRSQGFLPVNPAMSPAALFPPQIPHAIATDVPLMRKVPRKGMGQHRIMS
jgi:hypothetical protein